MKLGDLAKAVSFCIFFAINIAYVIISILRSFIDLTYT